MIIVEPTAGLCNRIRVIDSCISVQKNNPKEGAIKMIWKRNELLNCPFDALFEAIENIDIVKSNPHLSYFLFYQGNSIPNLKHKIKKHIYSFLNKNYKYFDDSSIQEVAYNYDFWNNSKHSFVIHSCIGFYSPELQNSSSFRPVQKLQKLINTEIAKFSKPTTGIHIRRTDNLKSIDKSLTGLFIKQIEDSLNEDENQLFFLATDDKKEEDILKSRFGKYILTQENKDLKRDSQKGIEDALVDLYSLSKTNLIWGSYWSSFSKVAAGLTKIPLKIIV